MLYVSWFDDTARSSFSVNSYILLPFVLIGVTTFLLRRAAHGKDADTVVAAEEVALPD
jgi:hypothetical protein